MFHDLPIGGISAGRRPLTVLGRVAVFLFLAGIAGCELHERAPERDSPVGEAASPERPVDPAGLWDEHPEPPEEPIVVEVEDRFWYGPDTMGAELVGRFRTREAMLATLDLMGPAIRVDDREWRLAELLVSVDFSKPGDVAVWQVAGPASVIEMYVARLRENVGERGALDDLGVLPLEVRHCCDPPEAR
jgi:hypothetical protein